MKSPKTERQAAERLRSDSDRRKKGSAKGKVQGDVRLHAEGMFVGLVAGSRGKLTSLTLGARGLNGKGNGVCHVGAVRVAGI